MTIEAIAGNLGRTVVTLSARTDAPTVRAARRRTTAKRGKISAFTRKSRARFRHELDTAAIPFSRSAVITLNFPDTDPQYQGADSLALLAESARRVRAAGWQIGNVDSTVIAQAPKLAPHILAMRQRVATALAVAIDQVSVKAKTAEGMGPVGRGEAMEARAVCLIWRP